MHSTPELPHTLIYIYFPSRCCGGSWSAVCSFWNNPGHMLCCFVLHMLQTSTSETKIFHCTRFRTITVIILCLVQTVYCHVYRQLCSIFFLHISQEPCQSLLITVGSVDCRRLDNDTARCALVLCRINAWYSSISCEYGRWIVILVDTLCASDSL